MAYGKGVRGTSSPYAVSLRLMPYVGGSKKLVESAKDLDPVPQLLDVQLLVGRVESIIGEADPREQDRRPALGERRHDRNRATRPRRDRSPPHRFLERLIEQAKDRVVELDLRRVRPV